MTKEILINIKISQFEDYYTTWYSNTEVPILFNDFQNRYLKGFAKKVKGHIQFFSSARLRITPTDVYISVSTESLISDIMSDLEKDFTVDQISLIGESISKNIH